MVISLIHTPPFLAVERARGNSNARIQCSTSPSRAVCDEARSGCRAKDHESMKVQSVCGQKTRCSFRTTTS